MTLPLNKRDNALRQLLRAKLNNDLREPYGGLGIARPEFDKRTRQWRIKTKGEVRARLGDPPRGVCFKDGSFLTLMEIWSEDGELLYASYHFQVPDPTRWRFFRYDRELPDPPPVGKPRYHLHVSSPLHFPTGEVTFEQVLDAIAEYFRLREKGEEGL